MGCPCGGQHHRLRFGPHLVTRCTACHRLRMEPITDARVPDLQEHVDCLLGEIRAAQEESQGSSFELRVDRAQMDPAGARIEGQLVSGRVQGLTKGARLEAWPSDTRREDASANVEVLDRSASHVRLLADSVAWRDLRAGVLLSLQPRGDATVYRNLLKAFLAVQKHHDLGPLMHPSSLPPLDATPVRGIDVGALRPGQAKALWAMLRQPPGGVAMVHGPPGTGKTTVIARFLLEAARRGETVLLTSHTHVAIDNALRKALRQAPHLAQHVVRLGQPSVVAPDLATMNRQVGSFHMDPEEEGALPLFAHLQSRFRIVATTLDALASSYLFASQTDQPIDPFDHVIVDEAGMNGFPKTALAHAVARRLVLVGDPLQLPPIVRARGFASDENHRRSSFETLQRQRPDLAVLLDEQFRCHPDIYEWSRDTLYEGRVASRKARSSHAWTLEGVPLPGAVVWLDTGSVPGAGDQRVGTSRVNEAHQRIAAHILLDLHQQGVPVAEMGYISPFRAQAEAFQGLLQEGPYVPIRDIAASTVDAFQGNERRIILYDLTTRRPAKPHQDPRRLNVSLTRAEELLLILGARRFVERPEQNPYHASLQAWPTAATMAAPRV